MLMHCQEQKYTNDLREMIPKPINIMTRKMTKNLKKGGNTTNEEDTPIKKDKSNKKGNSDRESDHIYMWNSISCFQIKGYLRLNFIME